MCINFCNVKTLSIVFLGFERPHSQGLEWISGLNWLVILMWSDVEMDMTIANHSLGIPNPPFLKGEQTIPQSTKWNFIACPIPPYKKSPWRYSNLFARWIGILKKHMKSMECEDNVLLTKVILSPFDRYIFFKPTKCGSTFSMMWYHAPWALDRDPRGKPK